MEPKDGPVCARCGWSVDEPFDSAIALPPGTILNGQYRIGTVLGAGGFGVTYIALDLALKWKLAIKEYYPAGFGARAPGMHTIAPINRQFQEDFENGLSRFMQEGQALAKFQHHPGVVSVVTLFRENGTAYLVMRYEDGVSLKEYLEKRGGRIEFGTAHDIFMRVMDTLRAVHAEGLLHRDISPENIYINQAGQVKLLDFGAAKHDMASKERSLQITVKRGYSPIEQYTDTPGRQGPWTDVYAVAATIYRALTGETPPESVDRHAADRDPLAAPGKFGVTMPRSAEKALLRGLAIAPANRFRSIEEFQNAFREGDPIRPAQPDRRRPAVVLAAAFCLAAVLALWLGTPDVTFTAGRSAIASGQSTVLEWNVGRGSVVISPDIGPRAETTGKVEVSPKQTTKYVLTANGFLRRSTRFVTVEVLPPEPAKVAETATPGPAKQPELASLPVISAFRATPASIQAGQTVTLEWNVLGQARSIALRWPVAGKKAGQQSVELAQSGTRTIMPEKTTTYTLVAIGNDGKPVTLSASVSVTPVHSASERDHGDSPLPPPRIPDAIPKLDLTVDTFEQSQRVLAALLGGKFHVIRLQNSCSAGPIQVAIRFQALDRTWVTRGWWRLDPNREAIAAFAYSRNGQYYFYATGSGMKWEGNAGDPSATEITVVDDPRFAQIGPISNPLSGKNMRRVRAFRQDYLGYGEHLAPFPCR